MLAVMGKIHRENEGKKKSEVERQSFLNPRTDAMSVHNGMARDEEIFNKDHVSDINYAEQHTRWFLTILGIWPLVKSNPTRLESYVSMFVLPFPSLFIILLLTPILCHVAMRDVSFDEVLAVLGPISYQITNIMKSFILVARRNTIKIFIKHIETDWRRIENQSDREIMMRNTKLGRGLSTICLVGMYGSACFFNSKPLLSGTYTNALNQSVRPLAFPGPDLFIDLQHGYNYHIVWCINCVSAFFLHFIVTTTCNLAAVFVTHACGQMQIVMARLESLAGSGTEVSDIVTAENKIAFIIRNHVRVLKFATTVDEFLREMCLMEVVCSTLLICWLEYFCISEWENSDAVAIMSYFLLLVSFCFNIFVFCHIGELLKEQCSEVGKASYMIEWYKLPGKTGLALVMVLAMANYPCKLTAGRMMELSYFSFGSIMKTSFGYLNMLRQANE